ncbi:MAG TPA: site-specific integrase, partial [Planctomycetota bacterium]|nr:site-specific integrase [Planctomycetota bacterium]
MPKAATLPIAPERRRAPLARRLGASPLLPAIESWLDDLRKTRRLSLNTVEAYRRDALDYAVFASGKGVRGWSEATRTLLDGYFATLHRDRLARRTLMRRRSALGRFHQFLLRHGESATDASFDVPAPRPEHRLPTVLAPEDLEAILAQDGDELP